MGIFGALTTAISGLQAESLALEHISNNIANSRTTAYKRVETSFSELVAESNPRNLGGGVVLANSRPTNDIQGDIQSSEISTHMAINGEGYFIVEQPAGSADGLPTFQGVDLYTRRGDFETDRNGFLVNGAGYFLKGIPIDPVTGNPAGNQPSLVRISRDFLSAQATTDVSYRANLAQLPQTANYDANVPDSELLSVAGFAVDPTVSGTGIIQAGDTDTFLEQSLAGGAVTSFDAGGNPVNIQLRWAKISNIFTPATTTGTAVTNVSDLSSGIAGFNDGVAATTEGSVIATIGDIGGVATAEFTVNIGGTANTYDVSDAGDDTLAALVASINGDFGAGTATITGGGSDQLTLTALNKTDTIIVTDVNAGAAALVGLTSSTTAIDPTASVNDTLTITVDSVDYDFTIGSDAGEVNTLAGLVAAIDGTATLTDLITPSIDSSNQLKIDADNSGTAFAISGTAATGLGMTAATNTRGTGGEDNWNLFYLSDSTATGSATQWVNVGQDYIFGSNQQTDPAITSVVVDDLTVNGINLGDISLEHGATGLSQFADINGSVTVTDISQNGFPTGELSDIAISDDGRIVGVYSNGESLDLFDVTLVKFNAGNQLSKLDGGAFAESTASGEPLFGSTGKVIALSLEGSNADVANEFSKLIVTQQAYAAGTRIVSTSDEMLQEALNMVR